MQKLSVLEISTAKISPPPVFAVWSIVSFGEKMEQVFEYFSTLSNWRRLSSNDDAQSVSRTVTAQLVDTLYINLFLFAVLVSLFELLRGKKSIYMNRRVKRFIQAKRVPEAPGRTPFAWISKIMMVSEEQTLEMVGLDGYMCIRFIVVCFRTACFCSVLGLLILVPVFMNTGDNSMVGWDRFTIANIPNDSSATRLWAPVIMCYVFA